MNLPTPLWKILQAVSARQISDSGAPLRNWTTISLRRLVSGSCIATCTTLFRFRSCFRNL